ncbi:hypothetical protein LPJ55_000830 [Coemansia sp. RSA 990]|nr:hypothetical protein LPJ55_000830 [Coemansia sp. RSA 990]
MSSRAVRRLMKERGHDDLEESAALIEKQAKQIGSEEREEKEQAANLFDLLGGNDASDHDSDQDSSKGAIEEKEENSITKQEPVKKAGAKKKKGKKKGKQAAKTEDMSMKEFEAHLKELDEQLSTPNSAKEDDKKAGRGEALGVVLTEEQQQNRALLMVDAKHLDSESEIKRLFGSAALKEAGGRGNGRRALQQRGLGSRRLALSHPKPTWPPMMASPGVDMRQLAAEDGPDTKQLLDSDKTGGQWFAIEHSARFRTVQLEFLSAVITNDADRIAAIAYQHPYHVDALLQLSEILKQTGGDFGEAGTLVERALYSFEQGFASRFSITNGLGRLDFRRIESRGLFLALFRHMQFMARRGCWRTASEVNKVLLSLDPVQDPYGALLTLDFHAMKSRQYDYVRQFYDSWTWSSVSMLPGWAYSRALAEFMLEKKSGGKSTDLLVEAILVFPTVIPVLCTKANIDIDPVVLTHPYFEERQITAESAMTHMQLLVQLFVERSSALFRTPEVARWLQEGLLLALEQIALGGTCARDITAAPQVVERRQQVESQLCTYVIPERISRHVLVADMDALKAGLPEQVRSATSYAFDPLPPSNDINIYAELVGGMQLNDNLMNMPGGFAPEDFADLDALNDAEPEVVMGLIERMRQLLGTGGGLEDPGTSSDEDAQ